MWFGSANIWNTIAPGQQPNMDASDASAMTSEGEENASDAEFSCCASATIEQLGVSTLGASAAIATHSGAAPTRLQPTQPNNVAPPETDDDEPLYTDPPLSGDELVPLSVLRYIVNNDHLIEFYVSLYNEIDVRAAIRPPARSPGPRARSIPCVAHPPTSCTRDE